MKNKVFITMTALFLILYFAMDSDARTRRRNYYYDNPTFFTSVNAGFFLPTGGTQSGGGLDDGFTIGVNSFVPMKIKNLRVRLPQMAMGISGFYSHAAFLRDNENDGDSSYSLFQIVPSVRAIDPFGSLGPMINSFLQAGVGIFRSSIDSDELLDLTTNDIGFTLGGGVSVNRFEYMGNFTYIFNDNEENMFVSLTLGYKFF